MKSGTYDIAKVSIDGDHTRIADAIQALGDSPRVCTVYFRDTTYTAEFLAGCDDDPNKMVLIGIGLREGVKATLYQKRRKLKLDVEYEQRAKGNREVPLHTVIYNLYEEFLFLDSDDGVVERVIRIVIEAVLIGTPFAGH